MHHPMTRLALVLGSGAAGAGLSPNGGAGEPAAALDVGFLGGYQGRQACHQGPATNESYIGLGLVFNCPEFVNSRLNLGGSIGGAFNSGPSVNSSSAFYQEIGR